MSNIVTTYYARRSIMSIKLPFCLELPSTVVIDHQQSFLHVTLGCPQRHLGL